jgi:chemotaxis protein histidine kinase CheA
MDELIKDFLVESNENLDRLDSELVKLESDPSSQELLSSIFRTIHTIKGSCGFLGFSKLEKGAHVGESLLSRLRDGELLPASEFASGLLAMVDAIRTMLGEIQSAEQAGNETYPDFIETLNRPQNQHIHEINDSEEIVVNPLRKQLRGLKIFAGATIMGDGKVALILDVVGLAQNASTLSEGRDGALTEKTAEMLEREDQNRREKRTFLLFAGPDDSQMELPLSAEARLEEFRASDVQKSAGEWAVQYRGRILPLIRLDVVLEERRTRTLSKASRIIWKVGSFDRGTYFPEGCVGQI